MVKNDQEKEMIEVTIGIDRSGWAVLEQFAARHRCEPHHLLEETIAERLQLFLFLLDQADDRVVT